MASRSRTKLWFWLIACLWAIAALAALCPIASIPIHAFQLALYSACWISFVLGLRRFRIVVAAFCILPLVLVALIISVSKPIDVSTLRSAYQQNLKRYEGTKYVWGGENHVGIDCSGLPRKALRMAFLQQGLIQFNGTCVREYLRQWWYDASAKALAEGYREYTVPLNLEGKIYTADYGALEPGDLAVTKTGIHVLVFLGGNMWIQADPGVGKVALFDGRASNNQWFKTPVRFYRWSVFQTSVAAVPSKPRG